MAYIYNGERIETRNEFIYRQRGFGEIDTDEQLLEYAEKVSYGFQYAGHRHKFTECYLSDYALSHPYCDLTETEFKRLKALQAKAIAEEKAADEAHGWELVDTIYWADNSVEQLWRAKDGGEKTVMVEYPHGDACY